MNTNTPARIALSLISHTNVGKTTLARTLVGQDLGTVRDEPHVTDASDNFSLIETPLGDVLELWDTPGFGDSARLERRLAQSANPIGWFLSEVWDRFRDRPFWSTQMAVRNVRDHADVVLYLVNAAERPSDAGYVEPEMRVLALIGKPVLVLLNQMGPPRPPAEEAAQVRVWQTHLATHTIVRGVLALDAFARCWVQEVALLRAVADVLPPEKQDAFSRLREAWQARRQETFTQALDVLARRLARAATDREPVLDAGLGGKLRELGAVLGLPVGADSHPKQIAMQALAARLDADIQSGTDRLIALHGLGGQAHRQILTRLADHYAVRDRLSEGKAAVLGGFVTGAVSGLTADLAAGGLSFGAGLLTGGVLGALGAAGLARGYNLVRGADQAMVAWTEEVLHQLTSAAVLGYLTVAHYGRGRGEWAPSEAPSHWQATVAEALSSRRATFERAWSSRADADASSLGPRIAEPLTDTVLTVLERLYPGFHRPSENAASPIATSADYLSSP